MSSPRSRTECERDADFLLPRLGSITQCPTAPGESMTYTWRATQYGSSWYHSHFALQAWEGVFGGIIINGPATANYDEDLGVLMLNDWDHQVCSCPQRSQSSCFTN